VIDKINIGLITATAGAVVYMFTTFASAADVERIEARLIKQELRELRAELAEAVDSAYREAIMEDIEEAIDDLCMIKPDDRECK
jgi:uncharacterized membrane protein